MLVVLTLFFILTFSGFLDILNLANYKKNSYVINSASELKIAQDINNIITDRDIILTATRHNNPLSNYTKGQVIMGYGGWLWSYGINFSTTLDDIFKMYRDPGNTKELLKQYNVSYVFISDAERSEYLPYESYFDENYQLVYQNGNAKLFRVSE